MDARTVYLYRQRVRWAGVVWLSLATMVGVAIAGFAMATLTPAYLQLVLAIFSITFALWQPLIGFLGRLPAAALFWGMLSGISSTLLHAGGPPLSIYFLAKRIPKKTWIAQAALLFALMNWCKIIPYTLNHVWHLAFLWIDAVLLPVAWLGIGLGYRMQAWLSESLFVLVCRVLLGVTGLILLLKWL